MSREITNKNNMKKIYLLLITTLFLIPKHVKAQSDGAAIAAAVTGAAAIGAMIASIDQMEEQAELTATQWILYNHPELTSFSLKTLSFDGKKAKDMSSTTVITYKIQEFTPEMNPELNGKKTSVIWIYKSRMDFRLWN